VSKCDSSYPVEFERVLKLLLLSGCDVNTQAFNTLETPLYRAISFSKFTVAKVLLAYGADPNLSSPFDITALHLAVLKKVPEVVTMMLLSGINWSREHWLENLTPSQTGDSQSLIADIHKWRRCTTSLVNICRQVFRKHHTKHLYSTISNRTDIPTIVKQFILFSDVSDCELIAKS